MAAISKSAAYKGGDIDKLVSELNCDSRTRCLNARRALELKGQDAVPPLADALKNGQDMAPMHAAKALGKIGGPVAIQALVGALKDDRSGVRWAAAEALIKQGPDAIKPVLKTIIENNNSSLVREAAHHVLSDIDEGPLKIKLAPVVEALEDGVPALEAPVAAKRVLDTL